MSATGNTAEPAATKRRYLKTTQPARYLTAKQAADYTGIGLSTLSLYRATGRGPSYVRWGPQNVRYDVAELDRWMAEHRVVPAPKYTTTKRRGRPRKSTGVGK